VTNPKARKTIDMMEDAASLRGFLAGFRDPLVKHVVPALSFSTGKDWR
jgi:hypothetical protein